MKPNPYAQHTPAQLEVLLAEVQRGRKPKVTERRALLAYMLKHKPNDPLYHWMSNQAGLAKMLGCGKSTLYTDFLSLGLPRHRKPKPAPKPRQRKAPKLVATQVVSEPKQLELTAEQEREFERVARERLRLEAESRRLPVGCQGNQMGKYGYTGG